MYRCIIFDLDGTLIDTSYGIITSVNLSLQKEGIPQLPPEKIMPYIGGGAKKLISSLFSSLGITDEQLMQNIYKNFYEYYIIYCDKNLKLLFDFTTVKQFCGARDILTVLFTNKDKSYTQKILNTLNIVFKEVICPPAFPLKPDGTGINYLINKYTLMRQDTVIIGDSIIDYQTALNSRIKCILVGWGFTPVAQLPIDEKVPLVNNSEELLKFLNNKL